MDSHAAEYDSVRDLLVGRKLAVGKLCGRSRRNLELDVDIAQHHRTPCRVDDVLHSPGRVVLEVPAVTYSLRVDSRVGIEEVRISVPFAEESVSGALIHEDSIVRHVDGVAALECDILVDEVRIALGTVEVRTDRVRVAVGNQLRHAHGMVFFRIF